MRQRVPIATMLVLLLLALPGALSAEVGRTKASPQPIYAAFSLLKQGKLTVEALRRLRDHERGLQRTLVQPRCAARRRRDVHRADLASPGRHHRSRHRHAHDPRQWSQECG